MSDVRLHKACMQSDFSGRVGLDVHTQASLDMIKNALLTELEWDFFALSLFSY